jgi:serine/threonine protein kinase/TolB-like protein
MGLSIPQMALMSRLLDEALPLDAAGRRAWLEKLSPPYRDLAAVLREALLPEDVPTAGSTAASILPKLDFPAVAPALAVDDLRAGVRVGPYELIRPLGAGGMAQVWLARRADGAFKRDVAVKVPALTHRRAEIEQRFARERDILASLEHPHIARFYDAGVDVNGLPYLALEYVQGETLTEWCDAHRLPIPARLELFLQVLDAVRYAHAKHVVHRDLKPSNILVKESGEVQLLDFGVARLLEAEETDRAPLTTVYGRALTPDYASPELLRGDPTDARSDVYSLGVVLYELLAGVRPYRLKRAASLGLFEQAMSTVEVKPPSAQSEPGAVAARASTPQQLPRQLRGDLDAIALKALSKDPADRYPSVAALAEDLRRHLDEQPVQARPARPAYRLGKFVRRNRATVGVSALAVAAILAAVGYARYGAPWTRVKNTNEAVDAAQTEAATAASLAVPVTGFSPATQSIAVLPFVDLSERKDQEYFADGMAEEIIDLLTKVPELKVIGRTSSFQFKGKADDLRKIGTTLGAAYVVEGSVGRSGEHVRITAQLIDTRDGTYRWSETYDRNASDVLTVEEEVALGIVRALQLEVASTVFGGPQTAQGADAYDQYLRGLHARDRWDRRGFEEALAHFRHALQLEPSFSQAAEAIASTLYYMTYQNYLLPESGFNQARSAAAAALKLDPASSVAHAVICLVNTEYDWNWPAAARECTNAARISPNQPFVLQAAAIQHMALGQWKDAAASIEAAIANDPLDPALYNIAARIYDRAGRMREAEAAVRRALQISPSSTFNHHLLGIILLLQGRATEALAEMRQESDPGARALGLTLAYHALHRDRDADTALARLIADNARDWASSIAAAYAFRAQKNLAFAWLDRAFAQRDNDLCALKGAPLLKNLEGDPRYTALLRRMHLPQ